MWLPFIFSTAHFALNFFGSVVGFAIFWLYFEGWRERRNNDELPLLAGYLLLALSFLIHASFIEDALLRDGLLAEAVPRLHTVLFAVTRAVSLVLITIGLLLDPLPQHPDHTKETWWDKPKVKSKTQAVLLGGGVSLSLLAGVKLALPLLAGVVGALYWRRGTTGLERHLKPIGIGFGLFCLSELLGLHELLRGGATARLFALTAPFGLLWTLEHVVLAAAIGVMGWWVWHYLLKRFFSQLFIVFTAFTVTVFLITTTVFTGLLIYQMRQSALEQLAVDTRVLALALESRQRELLSAGQSFAQRADVAAALVRPADAGEAEELQAISEAFLLVSQGSSLAVVDADGAVVARGENPGAAGGSLSDDPLVARALAGEAVAGALQSHGVLGPAIHVRAAVPVRRGEAVVGAVLLGTVLDNAFVDGVKAATGLDAAIYSGEQLAATTLIAEDGTSRWVGVTEDDPQVRTAVLERGEAYIGSVRLLHASYMAAYLPVRSSGGDVIGMLFAGRPELGLWQAVGRSVELTYLVVALLGALSLVPAYFVARYIAFQVK